MRGDRAVQVPCPSLQLLQPGWQRGQQVPLRSCVSPPHSHGSPPCQPHSPVATCHQRRWLCPAAVVVPAVVAPVVAGRTGTPHVMSPQAVPRPPTWRSHCGKAVMGLQGLPPGAAAWGDIGGGMGLPHPGGTGLCSPRLGPPKATSSGGAGTPPTALSKATPLNSAGPG